MKIKKLEERMAYWQAKLRLMDWDLSIELMEHSKIEGNAGRMRPCPNRGTAQLQISVEEPEAHEATLVHELLHLRLQGMETADSPPCTSGEEQGIDRIAHLLIALDARSTVK